MRHDCRRTDRDQPRTPRSRTSAWSFGAAHLVLAVLARLGTEHYGYALRKALVEKGMEVDENTLYPLLRRLETQGLLDSTWRETDSRPKRFYRLSPVGEEVLGACSSSGPTLTPPSAESRGGPA